MRSDPYEPTSTGIGVGRGGAATQNAAHLYSTGDTRGDSFAGMKLVTLGDRIAVAVGSTPEVSVKIIAE